MTHAAAVETLYQSAMACTACFSSNSELHLATIDLPQPRWVGAAYHASKPRVLVVMLNPGQGDGPQLEQNLRLKHLLHQYKRREANFGEVMAFQRQHMPIWGRPQGRFLPFYTTALGLKLDELSLLNVALCATKENKYPRHMLSRCFETHTSAVAVTLQPDVVLLSGSASHSFLPAFAQRMPQARVLPMLHYAHREGSQVEAQEHARIRTALSSAAEKRGA